MGSAIAIAAALVAAISAWFAWLQVREAQAQTRLQREVMESSAQPYVWADVRVQEANGWFIEFVVGNSGSTVATDVRVSVSPPFPQAPGGGRFVEVMHQRLESGISSLAPGKTLSWSIGPSHELVNRDGDLAHQVKVRCNGPYGPVQTCEYVIDLADFAESVAVRTGTLHEVAERIEELAKRLPAAQE